jgi:hypothetical protein
MDLNECNGKGLNDGKGNSWKKYKAIVWNCLCNSANKPVAAAMAKPSQRPATINICKPEAAITVFELLMMGGVSLETC